MFFFCFVEPFPHVRVLRNSPARPRPFQAEGIDALSAPFEAIANRCSAALPRLSWSSRRRGGLAGRGETGTRALSLPSPVSVARVRAGVADQLNMSTTAGCGACACARPSRARRGKRRRKGRTGDRGSEPSGGEKEGTGRRAERGDECLAYGLCGARYRRDRLETGVHARSSVQAASSQTRRRQELEQERTTRLVPTGRQRGTRHGKRRGKEGARERTRDAQIGKRK